MICRHCGYDVPNGIDFCTNCGEPMGRAKKEDDGSIPATNHRETLPPLSKKEFAKSYIPHGAKLCIHTGAIMSYFYVALYFVSLIGVIWLDKATKADIILLIVTAILAALTTGFEVKKNTACAIAVTVIAVAFTVYCLAAYHQLTVIWICAGLLASYGTYRYNKIWNAYQKTGKRPKKID